jgi:hypothetical protein
MAMGEMAASIVHEINQTLAAVAANANAGLRRQAGSAPDLDEVRAALQHIVNNSQRVNEVIDNHTAGLSHAGIVVIVGMVILHIGAVAGEPGLNV